jgi:UMF1 family MFS transporter
MNKREIFAWGMYDLANTIFSALFVTFFFPFYVKTFLGGTEFQIGLVFGLSMLFVGIFVPLIGAWSDSFGRRMPFIIVFTIICCFFTMILSYADLAWALAAGFLANFSYHAALTTYNALLPKIAPQGKYGLISGIGTGMGYLGTLIALALAALLLSRLGWETAQGARAVFIATSIMFLIFSLWTFFGIREKVERIGTLKQDVINSFTNVLKTLKELRKNRAFFWFLLAMFMFADAMMAVIIFLFLYARQEIGLTVQAFFIVYTMQAMGAAIGSFAGGKIIDKIGAKRILVYACIAWMLILAGLFFVANVATFTILGVLGGAALGIVWTAQRPLLLKLAPEKDVGQFFGFLELTGKFSGVVGPIVFGALASYLNYKAAIISLFAFFLIGLWCLKNVPGDQKKNIHLNTTPVSFAQK